MTQLGVSSVERSIAIDDYGRLRNRDTSQSAACVATWSRVLSSFVAWSMRRIPNLSSWRHRRGLRSFQIVLRAMLAWPLCRQPNRVLRAECPSEASSRSGDKPNLELNDDAAGNNYALLFVNASNARRAVNPQFVL